MYKYKHIYKYVHIHIKYANTYMYMYTYLYIQSRLRTVSIYRLHFCWIFSVSWESPSPILPSIYSECSSSSSNVQRNTSTFKHGFSIIEKIEIVNQNFLFPFLNPSKMYQYIFSLPPFIDYLGTGITSPPPQSLHFASRFLQPSDFSGNSLHW